MHFDMYLMSYSQIKSTCEMLRKIIVQFMCL